MRTKNDFDICIAQWMDQRRIERERGKIVYSGPELNGFGLQNRSRLSAVTENGFHPAESRSFASIERQRLRSATLTIYTRSDRLNLRGVGAQSDLAEVLTKPKEALQNIAQRSIFVFRFCTA